MDRVIVKAGWDDTKPVSVLKDSNAAVMMKTVVDEMEFPEFIVKTIGPFSTERVFKYDQYALAEDYYNYLSNDLYHEHNDVSKW